MPVNELNIDTIPKHVGIIMDGNGRWAKKRNLPRTAGHKIGVDVARNIMKAAEEYNVKYLTLYTFSTENWKRSKNEVDFLMNLLRFHIRSEKDFYIRQNIRFLHAGDLQGLSEDLQREITDLVEVTKNHTGLNLILAINYGGRDEILRAMKKMQLSQESDFSESNFYKYLDNPDVPEVDLIIRTGGEKRLSNFLMWESPYAELEFTDILWPDYKKEHFYNSLLSFQNKNRRFGAVFEEEKQK